MSVVGSLMCVHRLMFTGKRQVLIIHSVHGKAEIFDSFCIHHSKKNKNGMCV